MPRGQQDKAYTTFVNGFITEATGLNFPENACRDIDNCDIELKGVVRRRLGLNEEPGGYKMAAGLYNSSVSSGNRLSGIYSELPGTETCQQAELSVTAHPWRAPADDPALNFIVFQVGNQLIVRNWDGEAVSAPASITNHTDDTIIPLDDIAFGEVYGTSHIYAAKLPLQSAPGFGRLWMTGEGHKPFYLEFDRDARTITKYPVGYESVSAPYGRISIRDFNGVDDGLKVDEKPTTLSLEHRYNLLNQGWTEARIGAFFGTTGEYPSNAQQWILGKNDVDDFAPGLLNKQEFGNSPAPKGRNVLDALQGKKELGAHAGQDGAYNWQLYRFCRTYQGGDHGLDFVCASQQPPGLDSVSLTTLVAETAATSFRAVAFFAQRVWFAGETNSKRPGGVYFSKTLAKPGDAGLFMQENDPTSEHFSDLLATDGGVIYLPEANTIERLVPLGTGMLAMARNGIWFIYGSDTGFTATSYTIEKISDTGVISGKAVAVADDKVFFFAENGIQTLALPETGLVPKILDISNNKVYTYYAGIDRAARTQAQAGYDTVSKKVFWSFLSSASYNYPTNQSLYNRMLILDTRTGAFSKYSFTIDEVGGFGNGVVFPKRTVTRPQSIGFVITNEDGGVVDGAGNDVISYEEADTTNDFLNSVKIVLLNGPGAGLHVGEFYDTSFRDYQTMVDYSVQDYTSYVITGDETLGELQRKKQATYLHSFFRRTETGYEITPDATLIPENPSGCTVVARWDWHNTGAGGRWSDSQRAYRYRRPHTPVDQADQLDTGEEIVYTKLKIRGQGRSVTFRYESESYKDFQLLGFSVPFTADGV